MLTSNEQTGAESTSERTRAVQTLANPRRLRIGRDGRPLPLPTGSDED